MLLGKFHLEVCLPLKTIMGQPYDSGSDRWQFIPIEKTLISP